MNVAILSSTKLPGFLGDGHRDEQSLFAEDDVLAAAFAALGVTARRIPWRRDGVRWNDYDLVLIRSTWDYIDDLPRFLRVLADIEQSGCRLINPLETVRWNADKRYLLALRDLNVPIVPTTIIEPGEEGIEVHDELQAATAGFILKPVVGVGAFGTKRFTRAKDVAEHLTKHERDAPHILQPFVESVQTEGEWSFVFGAGEFLYSALKVPAPGDFRVQVMYGARTKRGMPAVEDLRAAQACFRALPVPAHVARIDMARMPNGSLALMEAELIEPQLFFFDVPAAAERVARATLRLTAADPS